jgi:hypothetical protein
MNEFANLIDSLNRDIESREELADGYLFHMANGKIFFVESEAIVFRSSDYSSLNVEKSYEVFIQPLSPSQVKFAVVKLSGYITRPRIKVIANSDISEIELISKDDSIYRAVEEQRTGIKQIKSKIITP